MMNELMDIRAMCEAFGVTSRTLRFYDAQELLFPIRKNGKRWFTRRDRERLTLILEGKRFGFSLEDMRQLTDLSDQGDTGRELQLRRAVELAERRLAEMAAQRDALESTIGELKNRLRSGARSLDDLLGPLPDRRKLGKRRTA